jgi:hypothetical protein
VNASVEVTVVVVELVRVVDNSEAVDSVTFSNDVDEFVNESIDNVVSVVVDVVNAEDEVDSDHSEVADIVEETCSETVEASDDVADASVESEDDNDVVDMEEEDTVLVEDTVAKDSKDDTVPVDDVGIVELAEDSSDICEEVETT